MVNAALSALLLGAGSAAVSAMPTTRDSCTFTSASDAKENKKDCSNITLKGITVPAGETLDLSNLKDGTKVTFEGTTTFEYEEWKGPLIRFSGTDIHITGAEGHLIDGNGAKWWDGEGTNGGKDKPKFFYAHDMTSSSIKGLNVKNTPVQAFSVNEAQDVQLIDLTIDNSDGDGNGGHNTDAFDVGDSTGVHISGANVKNQDDCLAINSGTDISFTGATCSGGHGISIGSVGGRDNNKVEGVVISDCTITDSDNGVRIKTIADETGSVKNITYTDITLKNIHKYGVRIEQDYKNGGPTGEPTDGIPITDVTLDGVTGSVDDDAQAIYILCAACSDWSWSGVDISGGEQEDECAGVPDGASC